MNAGEFARKRARIEQESWRRSARFAKAALARLVSESGASAMRSGCGKLLGWKLPNGQVVCCKEGFRTEEDALRELDRVSIHIHRNQVAKVPTRAYKCSCCEYWHLTSQVKNSYH